MIFTAHMDHPGLLYSRSLSPRDHLFELAGNVNVDLAKKGEVDIYDPAGTPDQSSGSWCYRLVCRGLIGGRPVFSVRTPRADAGIP